MTLKMFILCICGGIIYNPEEKKKPPSRFYLADIDIATYYTAHCTQKYTICQTNGESDQ